MVLFLILNKAHYKKIFYQIFILTLSLFYVSKNLYIEVILIITMFILIEWLAGNKYKRVISNKVRTINIIHTLIMLGVVIMVAMAEKVKNEPEMLIGIFNLLVLLLLGHAVMITKGTKWK